MLRTRSQAGVSAEALLPVVNAFKKEGEERIAAMRY
jgi:hypothetical protein